MKTYFDSSVLVSLLCVHSKYKPAADAALLAAAGKGFTATHALAETYRTLTTLQLPVPPAAASKLVSGLKGKIAVMDLPLAVYQAALAEVSRQGLAGAIVYDAVHCFAARAGRAERIITRNAPHFRLFSGSIKVVELGA